MSIEDVRATSIEIVDGVKDETVVASVSGTKYHLPWCSGAKRINEQNLVTFSNALEAKEAGYQPAKNCKGLE